MKILVFLTLLLALPLTCICQDMGVIEINQNFTATLNFSDDIEFIVLGNNPQIGESNGIPKYKYYDVYQSGKTCVIRGNDPMSPQTSITVKLLNGKIWYGTVKFGNNTKIYYDFSLVDNEKEQHEKKQESLKELKKEALISERLSMLMNEKPEYNTFGIAENKLVYQVSNIKNDDKHTYIKIIAKNNSGSDYQIDAVLFKYQEGKRRGVSNKEAKIEQRIDIQQDNGITRIPAYTTQELGYVIPLFSIGDKGDLIIHFKEKNGTRNPRIIINGKDMLKVKVFEYTVNK